MGGEQVVILLEADAQGLQGASLLDGESCHCSCCGFVCCRHHGFSPLGRGSALDAPCLMASYYPVCRESGPCTRQTAQTSARSEAQRCRAPLCPCQPLHSPAESPSCLPSVGEDNSPNWLLQ